ncbi:DUF3237 domain-containing protein [Tabrizicola sp.]|uniref:DUF3237 domain-containing protein n=1 Tax=Tabrizicola sp. TaxID=2005166 RepID=UPI0027325E50|nr:DUF3237 domain-containing protein [Tabrizicola sp.]MDP3195266.1 DUF3237 domain-containing protein [Tabrizicola sp.]
MTPFAEFRVEVGPPLTLGNDGFGEARIVPILGGTVWGDTLSGAILPGGSDEQRVRADGLTRIHARYVIRTQKGDLVRVDSQGLRHGLIQGDPTRPYFRTVIRLETSAPELQPLNLSLFVSDGQRMANHVLLYVMKL